LESIPRDACRRAIANEITLADVLARASLALRDEEPAKTRAPFHLGQSRMSRQRGMRASLWLRRPRGIKNLSVPDSVNAAMRAADNCHPLPDQLHPCSSFSRFPRTSSCDAVRSREDRCVFTTPSIAFAGGPVLLSRIVRSQEPGASSRLSFRRLSPAAASTLSRWLSGYEENDQDRFFRASVKEGAKIAIRNEFHRWVPELSSLSPARGFATATERERVVFCSPQLPTAFPSSLRKRGADIGFATASVSSRPRVLRSALRRSQRVAFRFLQRFPSSERSNNRPSSISATESDARARPELPYLLRTSRPSLRIAVRFFTQMHHAREFPLSVTRFTLR